MKLILEIEKKNGWNCLILLMVIIFFCFVWVSFVFFFVFLQQFGPQRSGFGNEPHGAGRLCLSWEEKEERIREGKKEGEGREERKERDREKGGGRPLDCKKLYWFIKNSVEKKAVANWK